MSIDPMQDETDYRPKHKDQVTLIAVERLERVSRMVDLLYDQNQALESKVIALEKQVELLIHHKFNSIK